MYLALKDKPLYHGSKPGIPVANCRIVPTGEISRPECYFTCPNADECLDIAARYDWLGFEPIEHPGLLATPAVKKEE